LWNYASDAEDADDVMTYTITSETDPSIVDCSIDSNRWVDCAVQPGMTGTSDVTVQVTDTGGLTDTDVFTATVSSSVVNQPPVADAGDDQSVLNNTLVTLNGSASSDPDNYPNATLEYSWEQVSGPESVAITGSNTAQPTFTPETNGTYVFNLTVFDGQDYDSDTVTVNTYLPSDAISTTGLVFYNSSFNVVTSIPAGETIYTALTISNNKEDDLRDVPSIIDEDGFTILNSSDGDSDDTILSDIPGVPATPSSVTIWWELQAPGSAGSRTVEVDTAGVIDTGSIQVT
ncbi:MAG: PKD domain-containing protein, partial [Candidatus Woesearchaeota archaeon]